MITNDRLQGFIDGYREKRPLVVVTAYTVWQARLAEAAGVDLILVGDSLGNVEQGGTSTAEVSLEQMVYHTTIANRGRTTTPIVADLPKGSYETPDQAVGSAKALVAAGADAVKFEGNAPGLAAAILAQNIPVMGHLGLLPQSAESFRVRGKDPSDAATIERDALDLERVGCFSVVLECIPRSFGRSLTQNLSIATIGIGAGPDTSGQVLVFHDLLGLSSGRKAKFVPTRYPNFGDQIADVLRTWASDVRGGVYPSDEESYH